MGDKPVTDIISIPKNGSDAVGLLERVTREVGQPPFWRVNRGTLFRPTGTRKWPEVAVVEVTKESFRQGFVIMRYHDKTQVTVGTDELYKGHVVLPCDITEKWMVCKPGERNLHGKEHS